jgi:hypothetical protein
MRPSCATRMASRALDKPPCTPTPVERRDADVGARVGFRVLTLNGSGSALPDQATLCAQGLEDELEASNRRCASAERRIAELDEAAAALRGELSAAHAR